VKAQAENIYARLADGSVPCDGAWPQDQLDLFKRWIDQGMVPYARSQWSCMPTVAQASIRADSSEE
jgi:hypothetical protein